MMDVNIDNSNSKNIISKCVNYVTINEEKLLKLTNDNVGIIDINELECENVDIYYITSLFNHIFSKMIIDVYAKKFNDKKIHIVKRKNGKKEIRKDDYETIDEYYKNKKKRCEERETLKNNRNLMHKEKVMIKNNRNNKWLKENNYKNVEEYYKKWEKRGLGKIRKGEKRKGERKPDYKRGELDPNSTVGFAFISQRVVAKVLGLDINNDCNCEFGFNFKYDLYDENKHGSINVKTSTLHKDNIWHFGLTNKYEPDTYILTGFSTYKEDILHVWIIPSYIVSEDNTVNITKKFLNKFKIYEVDSEPYNKIYHSMSIENCKVLKIDKFHNDNKKVRLSDYNKTEEWVKCNEKELKNIYKCSRNSYIELGLNELLLEASSVYDSVRNLNNIFKECKFYIEAVPIDNNNIKLRICVNNQ